MNTEFRDLPPRVQQLLDEHMDAVERELLAAGRSRTDRRRICDDLEGQIREMLTARATGQPAEGDLRAVLAELDKPEAYGEPDTEQGKPAIAAASIQPAIPARYGSASTGTPPARQRPDPWLRTIAIIAILGALLFIVLPIVGILGAIAIPNFLEAQTRSKVARVRADQRALATAIESYVIDQATIPAWSVGEQNAFGAAAGALGQQPTFRTMNGSQLHTLTTPVAYCSSYFNDPFANAKGVTYCYYGNDRMWLLWSAGPDYRYQLDLAQARGLLDSAEDALIQSNLTRLSYDPTNGTTSAGEILHFGELPEKFFYEKL